VHITHFGPITCAFGAFTPTCGHQQLLSQEDSTDMLGTRRAAAAAARLQAPTRVFGRSLSMRQAAQMETEVLDRLRAIPDGLGVGDIVASGRVKVRAALPRPPRLAADHGCLATAGRDSHTGRWSSQV
jgi:hypothetical protein